MVAWTALALLVLATAGWAVSVARGNANVVDQLWGLSQIVVAAVCVKTGQTVTARTWLAAGLVAVWGLRLSAHLATRDRGRGEDWRHSEVRRTRPGFAWRSLPEVFWFQLVGGGLVVGLPLFAVVTAPQPPLGWVDGVAVAVWATGFGLESLADAQLVRFRRDPNSRGRVLDRGLWAYSRHPNYFGEVVIWTGLGLLGVAAGAWWALLSPLMVLVIIMRVSGVAVMETHLQTTRGDEYARYTRTTSTLIPRPGRAAPPPG